MKTHEVSPNLSISNRSNIPRVTSGADLADDIAVEEGDFEASKKIAVRQII